MIKRHVQAVGINVEVCCHTFRVTEITAYLKNGGTLETAAQMARHASTRTTLLYDRRSDEISPDDVERFLI
jgi:site-specific recombinase XerD